MQIHNKLMPWQIAIARRQFVMWATLPMIWSETFIKTFNEVYRYPTTT